MGDTENTIPPSKKRAAGRELSRDNPGLDDDEEEASGQETGTFKRASDEVLANRRIVKVRRSQTSSTPPSSNPFASIQLIPTPTDPTPPLQEPADIPQEPAKTDPEETKTEPEGPSEVRKPETETETEKADNLRNDENTPAPVNSFQQLSSSQNAFTGIVGTGFSSSTFSFGSITKTDSPTFPSFGFGTNGNHSSLFGTPSGTSDKPSGTKPVPTMQEVHVETGEENETAVFTADSVLFEFLEGGWKERGKGELKVNVLTTGTKKARLVMRARGNYRLILNASIFADMKLTNMEKKGVTFACVNSTGEGQNGLSTFALKFRDAAVVDEFRLVVDEQKGNTGGGAGLKTPENSPKASDE